MKASETEIGLRAAKDEVLRKIWRNMLLFQQVERMLKYLITYGTLSGHASELLKKREQQAKSIHKQTMGQLVRQYNVNVYSDREEANEVLDRLSEPHLSLKLRVEGGLDSHEARKIALASIVDDRNYLIHHFLPKFNPNSLESCLESSHNLDCQRDKLLPEVELLRHQIVLLQEVVKILAESLDTSQESTH